MDPRRVKKALLEIFRKLPLPPGYSVEFDPDAINQADTMSGTIFSLFMAIFFCYMVIASINESLIIPVVALCAIPPSLAVPALCMAVTGTPFTISSACAFIAVSGMTVNAAVLCADSLRPVSRKGRAFNATSLYRAIRKIFPALLATTATTIAGAFPFLFLKEEANTLIKNLSLVGTMGVAGSFICSITLVPALSLVLRKTNEQKWLNTHVFSLERKIN
jgi:multidrug efflux pump subunit AcrB